MDELGDGQVEEEEREREADGGRWREKRLSGCLWRLSLDPAHFSISGVP